MRIELNRRTGTAVSLRRGSRSPMSCLKIEATASSNEQFRDGRMPFLGRGVKRPSRRSSLPLAPTSIFRGGTCCSGWSGWAVAGVARCCSGALYYYLLLPPLLLALLTSSSWLGGSLGATPLFMVAQTRPSRSSFAVRCNVDLQEEIGWTPLHCEACYKSACLLVQKTKSTNAGTKDKSTNAGN